MSIDDPTHVYNFASSVREHAQLFHAGSVGPFIYPPSALLFMAPLGALPWRAATAVWVTATSLAFLSSGLRAGAKWWFLLFPPVAFVAVSGQTTFLVGALVIVGLTLPTRPLLAGALFGIAAAFKPQMLILVPLALIAERRYRALAAATATTSAAVAVSVLIWGDASWESWWRVLPAFQLLILSDPALASHAITPYVWLARFGIDGSWAFLLIPPVVGAVWFTFRRTPDLAPRITVIFAGTLLIIPYAMEYEAALLAPPLAMFLARLSNPRWTAFLGGSLALGVGFAFGAPGLALALSLILFGAWPSLGSEQSSDTSEAGAVAAVQDGATLTD